MPKRKATPAIPAQMQPVIDYMVKRYQEEGKAFDYQQFFSQIIGGFIWKSSTVLHCPHRPSLRSPIVFCQTSTPGKTALCSACTPMFSSMRLTSTWGRVLERLKARGIEDVLLFGVDGLHGMVDAIHAVFPDALVQRCIVHQLRNCFKLVPYKDRRALAQDMKLIYRAPTLDSAEQALDELEAKWGAKYPRVIKAWRDNWNELSTFYSLPVEMRRLVYTTNAIENYNRGLRKYTKNSVQFPTEQALEKHLYLAMLRIIANWHGQVYCWHRILNQLLLQFGDRILPEDLEIVM